MGVKAEVLLARSPLSRRPGPSKNKEACFVVRDHDGQQLVYLFRCQATRMGNTLNRDVLSAAWHGCTGSAACGASASAVSSVATLPRSTSARPLGKL
jgi:hypothetical protein